MTKDVLAKNRFKPLFIFVDLWFNFAHSDQGEKMKSASKVVNL